MLTETLNSKVNTIADVKLGLLLTEEQAIKSDLEMTNTAIFCYEFLVKYFNTCMKRDVEIIAKDKEVEVAEINLTKMINQ